MKFVLASSNKNKIKELRAILSKVMADAEVITLAEAGITISAQIVLCRGVNDGEELLRSMHDLAALYPALDSVSVVPAGLTRFREGLYPLSPFTPEECLAVVRTVEDFSAKCQAAYGAYLFHASDEFYLKAGLPLPSEEHYEGYLQLDRRRGAVIAVNSDKDAEMDAICDDMQMLVARAICKGISKEEMTWLVQNMYHQFGL